MKRQVGLMKFPIVVDRDDKGAGIVECPSIPGCVSQGAAKPGAPRNIREVIGGAI